MKTPFLDAYDDHMDRVYGFFAYRLDSRADAEDLTQVTFERALRGWDSFDPKKGSAKTWLLAIARNLLIDFYRQDPSSSEELYSDDGAFEHLSEPDPADLGVGLEPDLVAALATLSQRDREILALRFGGDLTGREIADVVGLSRVNVQQILSRSLRGLRAMLESGVPAAAVAQASGPAPSTPSAATSRQPAPEVA